jgi:hypothetical protein
MLLRVLVLVAAVCLFSLSNVRVSAQDQPAPGVVKPDRNAPFPAPLDCSAAHFVDSVQQSL